MKMTMKMMKITHMKPTIHKNPYLNNTPQAKTNNFTLPASIFTNLLEISATNNTTTK